MKTGKLPRFSKVILILFDLNVFDIKLLADPFHHMQCIWQGEWTNTDCWVWRRLHLAHDCVAFEMFFYTQTIRCVELYIIVGSACQFGYIDIILPEKRS